MAKLKDILRDLTSWGRETTVATAKADESPLMALSVYDTIELYSSPEALANHAEPWQCKETVALDSDGTIYRLVSPDGFRCALEPTGVENRLLFFVLLKELLRNAGEADLDSISEDSMMHLAHRHIWK